MSDFPVECFLKRKLIQQFKNEIGGKTVDTVPWLHTPDGQAIMYHQTCFGLQYTFGLESVKFIV